MQSLRCDAAVKEPAVHPDRARAAALSGKVLAAVVAATAPNAVVVIADGELAAAAFAALAPSAAPPTAELPFFAEAPAAHGFAVVAATAVVASAIAAAT